MKETEKLKPGDYLMPDGRTNHVLEVQDMHINSWAIFDRRLLKQTGVSQIKDAEKEKKNG